MGNHGVVTFVIGHNHQPSVRMLGSHIAHIKRKMKIQRVRARAGPWHRRYARAIFGKLSGSLNLMRAVEQPDIGKPWRELSQFVKCGLDIFIVHQCVQLFHRASRLAPLSREQLHTAARSNPLNHHRNPLPHANAHRAQRVTPFDSVKLIDSRGDQPRTGCT